MSRWHSALSITLFLATVAAPGIAEAGPSGTDGDSLRLGGDALTFPTTTLIGGVGIQTSGVTLPADVLFAFDSARLAPRARTAVDVAAGVLRERQVTRGRVVGYTDARGSSAYNLALSRRRAESVRRALLARLGAPAPRLRAAGRGERDPVAANTAGGRDDPKGRARNRRVEVLFE